MKEESIVFHGLVKLSCSWQWRNTNYRNLSNNEKLEQVPIKKKKQLKMTDIGSSYHYLENIFLL